MTYQPLLFQLSLCSATIHYFVVHLFRAFRGFSWKKAFLDARNEGKTVLHTRKKGRLE
jgi:hypothetical protein